ncbi:MAG: YggS family pyridoxal phosphate-dependent enzyme [Treponema sp.]|jgi:pyridoxal phosphate enzyme (YggS family)|nr:YggS family pyridoxal phosphate-dependent enzyme [Treponema sp.]
MRPSLSIAESLAEIREKILKACIRSGRQEGEIRLMGVSKFHPLSAIEEAWDAGLRLFGENRVQEAVEKFSGFKEQHNGAELHLIGPLQRNKVKAALSIFDCIQSVDRESLIAELGKTAANRKETLPLLLELHTAEESKSGFPDTEALLRAAEQILSYPGLKPEGLMTIAPFTGDIKLIRTSFRSLKTAQKTLSSRFPEADWHCLSMGMSNDFEIAIEEGATLIRIGTAIFGERG